VGLNFSSTNEVFRNPASSDNGVVSTPRQLAANDLTYWILLLTMYISNILQLPFRRSHAVSLSDAITQYISSKYDQRPDMFAEDLMIIDRLRSEAVNVQEPHFSGISRLITYAAQLKWLGGKFPIDVRAPPFGHDGPHYV
jgi:hypothetical protein